MKYPTTSKTLLEKLQNGDTISWHEFYNKYKGIVFIAGKYKGLTDSECEDLMQEVMIRFFKNSQTFIFDPNVAKFRTYLGRIISGKIIDIIRSRKHNLPLDGSLLHNAFFAEDELEKQFCDEWKKMLWEEAEIRLKSKVDAKTFLAYQLFAVQNRPLKDVMTALNLTANQIYLAKSRCIKHMRSIIEDIEGADDKEVSYHEI